MSVIARDALQTDAAAALALVRMQDTGGVWRRLPDVLRIELAAAIDQASATARIEVANPEGWYSPDQEPRKFPGLALEKSPWAGQLFPGAPLQIWLGYGTDLVLRYTGVIDRLAIDAGGQTLAIECRDNVALLQDMVVATPYSYQNMVASDILADLITKPGLTAAVERSVVADATSVVFQDDFEGVSSLPAAYITDGAGWSVVSNPEYGIVKSNTTAAGQTAGIQRDVTLTRPGFVQFDYHVRSNRLHFYVDGQKKATYMPGGWRTAQWQLAAGTHTLRWVAEDVGENGPAGRYIELDDIMAAEYTGGSDPYVVPIFTAEVGQTLWDEISRLAESLDYWVRAGPDGVIYVGPFPEPQAGTPPAWELTEYRDLTDADYTLDGSYVRNKIVVTSDSGASTFVHGYLLNTVSRGRERVAYVDVPWATTYPRRQVVAQGLFRKIGRRFRTVQVVTPGNPRYALADVVRLAERVTTAVGRYQIVGLRTVFGPEGYADTLDLEYVG